MVSIWGRTRGWKPNSGTAGVRRRRQWAQASRRLYGDDEYMSRMIYAEISILYLNIFGLRGIDLDSYNKSW